MPYPKQMNDDVYRRTVALMGTFVTIEVVGHAADPQQQILREQAAERAFGWFYRIEECCTRFEAQSEVMQLTAQVGVPVPVSTLLYEVVQFALAVAEESDGAFDPTVGYAMETRGFNRNYRTGRSIRTALEPGGSVSYRDVRLDPHRKTITLLRPLILDLGAVAKGLAIDLAARELRPFENFAIDAGGDLYLGGCNAEGNPWSIGIRHPRRDNELIDSLRVSNQAVCTSGDYERKSSSEEAWPSHYRSAHRSVGACRGQRDRRRTHGDAGRCSRNGGIRSWPGGGHPTVRSSGRGRTDCLPDARAICDATDVR